MHACTTGRFPIALTLLALAAPQLDAQVRFSNLLRNVQLGPSMGAQQSRIADFNGDGFLDLTKLDALDGISVYLSDGSGGYRVTSTLATLGAFGHRSGDFDGDGDEDILVTLASTTRSTRIYANDGNARFTDVSASRIPHVPGALYARVADFDRDGDLDIVVGAGSGRYTLLENHKGVFRNISHKLLIKVRFPVAHEVYDVNSDGRPDLVGVENNRLHILLQDAAGNFGARPIRFTTTTPAITLALGDIDKDGDTDIFVGAGWGRDAPYEANGLTWRDASTTRLPPIARGVSRRDARFVDIDEDGDLDLIIPKAGLPNLPDRTRVYVNDGRGRFRDVTASVLGGQPPLLGDVLIADYDGDGDEDIGLMTPNTALRQTQLRIEHSLMRHLSMPGNTKIGTQLPIDIYARAGFAPPGQLSLPFVALGRARRALPILGFGSLGLDPTQLITLPAQNHAPTSGLGQVRLPIPNALALAGQTVYAQALVLIDPRNAATWRLTSVRASRLFR